MNKKRSGQSLIEVVFSIGLITVVITGVVGLLINSLGARTKGYDRKKAVELSQIVIEGLVEKERNDPAVFWNLTSSYWSDLGTSRTDPNFSGFAYSAQPTSYSGNNCSATILECMNVVVKIGWSGSVQTVDNNKVELFNRFFSRKN